MHHSRPVHSSMTLTSSSVQPSNLTATTDFTPSAFRRYPMSTYHHHSGVGSKLLQQTSTLDDDDASAIDDMKARRIHNVLEQIRSRGVHDVGNDRRSMLDEVHSFANTLNGLDLLSVAATSSQHQRHEQPYSDRLAQTRSDLKALEQIVSHTFHWQPQQSSVYDSTASDVVDQHSDALMASAAAPRHGAVDYTQSSSLAELACRWAEQRRRALEQELELKRNVETEYRPSQRLSAADASRPHHLLDQYETWNYLLQPAQHLPVVDVAGQAAASPVVTARQPLSHSTVSLTATATPKPHISEARRKVRQALCKSRGDPHYFSRKPSEPAAND